MAERAAILNGNDQQFDRWHDQIDAGAGWKQEGEHHGHVSPNLPPRPVIAMIFMRRDGDLKQQHVQRLSQRQHRAHAKVEGQRELPRFREVIDARDDGASRERYGLIDQMRGDDRRAVGDKHLRRRAPRRAAAPRPVRQATRARRLPSRAG